MADAEFKPGASDLLLIAAVRSGDEGAMAALYDRYSSVVYSVALRVLGETGAAEDVLQEVFMQVWRNPGVFDSSRGNETVIVSVEPDLAGDAERSRAMEKVRSALGAMPALQRSALEMAYFEGLSHSEIAAKTGEPLGTVKTRIRAGLFALRKVFQI